MNDPTGATEPAAAAPSPTTTPPAPVTDPAAEVARLQAELETWKGHSRGWENKAKANLDAAKAAEANKELLAKVAGALGLEGATPDPAVIAQQLEAAKAQSAQLARERAVLLAAASNGADAVALLDSRTFLEQMASIDPADSTAVAEAVKAAVAANPRYAAQQAAPAVQQPPAASPTAGFAAPKGNEQWTAADVAKASPAQLSRALKDGKLQAYQAS